MKNKYKPLPTTQLEYKFQEMRGLKIFCICVGMIMLGGGIAFAVVVIGLTPQFLTDQDCYALVENATNQSMIDGISIGEFIGAKAVSDRVIQFDEMPIYYQINETTIGWEIINLTEYYKLKLNLIGGTK